MNFPTVTQGMARSINVVPMQTWTLIWMMAGVTEKKRVDSENIKVYNCHFKKKMSEVTFPITPWMTSIYDMARNRFTHHEISSKGISGAEILFILVERVLIGLTDHDGAIQCWFAILKKRVFSVIFILSYVMWMIIVCIMSPSLKFYLLLLYKCECTAEVGWYKVYVEVRGQICGVNSPLFTIMCLLRTELGSPGLSLSSELVPYYCFLCIMTTFT